MNVILPGGSVCSLQGKEYVEESKKDNKLQGMSLEITVLCSCPGNQR